MEPKPGLVSPTPGVHDGSELFVPVNGNARQATDEEQNVPEDNDRPLKRRPGRPRRDDAARVVIGARYTFAEAEAVRTAAELQSVTRAAFVHDAVVAATGRPDPHRLGAAIRAERRHDLLQLGAQLTELLEELRRLRGSAHRGGMRRSLVTLDVALADVREIRTVVAQEASR